MAHYTDVWKPRLWWLLLLAVLWVLTWYLDQALTRYPDFDGALNLNVSRALLEGHGYSSFYEGMKRFPIETQTNAPLVLPAAVTLAVFNITPFGGQAANLAYLAAFCLLAAALVWRVTKNGLVAATGVLLALQVPGMRDYALNGYGEIPALTWMLAATLALSRQFERSPGLWSWMAGVCLGLSFLTKTVALIWFPPVISLYLFLRCQRDGWRVALRDAIAIGGGIALVLVAWETYRAWSLGGPGAYLQWWDEQYLEVQKQAGVTSGYRDTPGAIEKLVAHLRGLMGMLQLPMWAGLLWLVLPFVGAVIAFRHITQIVPRFLMGVLLAVSALYLIWWLAITPTEMMWLRRIMIALVLLQLAIPVIAWSCVQRPQVLARVTGVGLAALVIWLGIEHQLMAARPDARAQAQGDAAFFRAVRELPSEATLFGSGWWQAPVAALYSGRPMMNEEAWDSTRLASLRGPAYLVLDHYAVALGDHLRWRLGWRCDCEPVYVGAGGRIYRMHSLFATPETSAVNVIRLDATTETAGQGFSAEAEGGVRWVEREARLRLPGTRYAHMLLDYVVPDGARYAAAAVPTLRVRRGDCTLGEVALVPGMHSALLEDRCETESSELRFEASNGLDPAMIAPDPRDLAWLFRGLELYPLR